MTCKILRFDNNGGFKGSGRPPIDRMHLKIRENFVPKCVIIG